LSSAAAVPIAPRRELPVISTPPANGPSALVAAAEAAPAARRMRSGWAWAIGVGVLAVAGAIALAGAGNGTLLERLLAPLTVLQQPYADLVASQGEDAATGAEYVAFLADGNEAPALDGFFRAHPAVRYVSPGLLPGMAVVRIRGDVPAGVQSLRDQPQVRMVFKSRVGMVCH
jgi:hypothetical protein